MWTNDLLIFNADGSLVEEKTIITEQEEVESSCSTMLNGQAIIFGGWNFKRQVQFK